MFSCHGHTDHSNYRLRDAIIKVPDFIEYHRQCGWSGCVVTEHETIGSHLDALKYFDSVKDKPEYKGFKLGLGNEIYLCPESITADNKGSNFYPHFILIALDAEGHKAIRELSTKAWVNNSFMSVMYRVPTYYSDLQELLEKYKGHLIGSSACFIRDTTIETKDGWKKIQNITCNDYVKNMYGKWEKVNFPTSRLYNDTGYEIETCGNYEKVICTKDHQFLTITHNKQFLQWTKAEDLIVQKGASKHILLYPCNTDYHESKYINKEEYNEILFPLTKYSNRRYTLPNKIEITPELMRLFGFYLGDGHTSLSPNTVVGFTINDEHFQYFYKDFLEPVEKQLKIKWYVYKRNDSHRVDISSTSRELVELFYYLFNNDKANSKKIPDRLRISKELDYELIFGYMLADGYFRLRNGNKKIKCPTGEFVTASISKTLSMQLHNMLYNIGVPNSITWSKGYISSDGVNHKDSWYVTGSNYILGKIRKEQNYSHNDVVTIFDNAVQEKKKYYIEINNIKYKKVYIKNLTKIHIQDEVYCLNNNTHSFKCQDVIVHNCLGGSIPRQLLKYRDEEDPLMRAKILDGITYWIETMIDWFGNEYFFLEIQPNPHEDQIFVNKAIIQLSQELGVPYIITLDAHYLKKEDREIHKAFLKAAEGDREVDDFYTTTYIMTRDEIHKYMDESIGYDAVELGLNNTMLIYDKIQYYSLTKDLELPYIPFDLTEPDKELFIKYKDNIPLLDFFYHSEYPADRHMTRELLRSIDTKNTHYQCQRGYEMIDECLSYIKISSEVNKVRWSKYLMQVRDYIKLAWEAGTLVMPGRGSGGGFCLLYLLDIIQVDPLREKTKLYPWRFLNPYRTSVLDIDTDIESAKREAVIQKFIDTYGSDRVSKVMTLQTEKSKSAILTASRGLGISNDVASYIASLVVFDRGQARSLKTMYYGDEENPPVSEFVKEMNARPQLWEVAQKIEGLISGIGSHAGGIIICDKPLTESTALMRTNSGDVITQFDLHGDEAVSLIKIDELSTDATDLLHATLNLLLKDNQIQWQGDLYSTYMKYLGIYNIDRDAPELWKMIGDQKIMNLFQFDKDSGKKALSLVKPHSVDDLATINSVIRLMPQNKGDEMPLEKYARFHENIQLWYDEMTEYGLTQEEQDILKDILGISYGICEAQEYLVLLTMHPKIGGFDLRWSDQLRKSVAKKNPKDFLRLEKEFFENAKEKNLSPNLTNYVWYQLIYTQRGYGFNKSHTLCYSCIGLQEAWLNYKYNPIYWQTANLIVRSGSYNADANDATDYGKMAVAIAAIQHEGVTISNPDINNPQFEFVPDVKNEQIIFSMKGVNGVNTELAQSIIQNAPYASMQDFATRMLDTKIIHPAQMIKLIKGGCFLTLHNPDRFKTMEWYLRNYCFEPLSKLTMTQLPKMQEFGIIPDQYRDSLNCIKIKQYVLDDEGLYKLYINPDKKLPKCGYHDRYFILDDVSQPVFKRYFTEDCVIDVKDGYYIISEKKFLKECNAQTQPLRDWFNSEDALIVYNNALFRSLWDDKASGTEASWNMEACCYYDQNHELDGINEAEYGIVNYFNLPENPEPYTWYRRKVDGEWKNVPKYRVCRIAGTVLKSDNNRHSVALLTCYGVVNVKFYKGSYAFYNKRISQPLGDGKKKVLEESWLKRGNKLLISGIRRDDQFFPLVYKDTIYNHTVNLIKNITPDGKLELQFERTKVDE